MKTLFNLIFSILCVPFFFSCEPTHKETQVQEDLTRIRLILDTDANNELDDQHAIAYTLFNSDIFDIEGITVNETYSGKELARHVEEAERVVKLCDWEGKVPVIPGASGDFYEIVNNLDQATYDGKEAVDFIIEKAREEAEDKLVLVPIGKLTNITLALTQAPDIIPRVKVIWLGSNWPEPGEYNLVNDTTAVQPLLDMEGLELEILTVRYDKSTGTTAVNASVNEIREMMPGLGPQVDPVPGRHGGTFTCFGDYSIELYVKYGDEVRSLFDVCNLAVLKNPAWGEKVEIQGASFDGTNWGTDGNPDRTVVFWENFDKEGIIGDFYATMRNATPK